MIQVWKAGTRLYFRSWKTGSLDEDDDKDQEKEDEPVKSEKNGPEDPSLLEDLGEWLFCSPHYLSANRNCPKKRNSEIVKC